MKKMTKITSIKRLGKDLCSSRFAACWYNPSSLSDLGRRSEKSAALDQILPDLKRQYIMATAFARARIDETLKEAKDADLFE